MLENRFGGAAATLSVTTVRDLRKEEGKRAWSRDEKRLRLVHDIILGAEAILSAIHTVVHFGSFLLFR